MRDDTQLTEEERYQIESLLKMGHDQSEIAVVLKRHKSTISREVRRNCGLRGLPPETGAAPGSGPPVLFTTSAMCRSCQCMKSR